jgi:hypothetical protein
MLAAPLSDSSLIQTKYRVAIMAPLYLDSIFSKTGNFRYQQGMPKFMMPSLDFVNGAIAALDSLQTGDVKLEAIIIDTKSYSTSFEQQLKSKTFDSINLIIGSVKDADFKLIAAFAFAKKIPFVSATYPNDGGVTKNPFLIIANPTLRAHCEAVASYLLQNHGTDKVYLCRIKGSQEDKIAEFIKKVNEPNGKQLVPIQTINLDSAIGTDVIQKKLDSNRTSVIIGGSLDETFATSLAEVCYDLSNQHYPIKLIGMPNWDGFKGLTKKDAFIDFPIYYTSPYFNNKTDSLSKLLQSAYMEKLNGKPSDMAYKGFESTYYFTNLLIQHPNDLFVYLNSNTHQMISKYNFRPILLSEKSRVPDYYENKHLYFLKILNGKIEKSW